MSARVFVDSNVLIYGHDRQAGPKHRIARDILNELWSSRAGVLSMQVLQEFYFNVTRKIPAPLSRDEACGIVTNYEAWCVEATVPADIRAAAEIEQSARISFWDALIVALAVKCQAARLLSEDLNARQAIAGVTVVNPFAPKPA